MPANTLEIPIEQLQAALDQFRQLESQAESVRATVDGSVRGIGSSWHGPASIAYNTEINNWLEDYQQMVAKPMTDLLHWFQEMIAIMKDVEAANANSSS